MQRRAAAIYAVFFLVLGAASYSLIATAEEPTVQFENPERQYQQGDTFSIDGRQYNVSSISATTSGGGGGGGHGGGGGGGATVTRSGQLTWTNESARHTETWANGSNVTLENQSYQVVIPNASNPNSLTLRENVNRSAILQNDTRADNQTVTRNGSTYVVVQDQGGNATLVPADEYFPEPRTRQLNEGQTFPYAGNQTTVTNITTSQATVAWTAPRTNQISVSDEANVTLNGQTYLAKFPDNETLVLTQDFQSYHQQQDEIARFNTYVNGLWGVVILSTVTVIFLLGLAYLPSRY